MTKEEQAEEYVNTHPCYKRQDFIRTYLDGLAEGKPKWYDLREDPNDLPPKEDANSSYSINVFTDTEDNAFYSYYYNIWVRESDGLRIPKVIAWCELPQFKE